jgi:hypothetical protein
MLLVIFGAFSIAGILSEIVGYYNWSITKKIIQKGIKAEGTVLRNQGGNRNQWKYSLAPVITFSDTEGHLVTYYLLLYNNPPVYQPWEKVAL